MDVGIGGVEAVGHVELRSRLRRVVERVSHEGLAVAVTNHNRVEAYLVPAEALGRLVEAEGERDRMRSSLPILIAALTGGVAYPAEALRSLVGTDLPIDWRKMNAFQAAFATETTRDEDGGPLGETTGHLAHESVVEFEDELRYA